MAHDRYQDAVLVTGLPGRHPQEACIGGWDVRGLPSHPLDRGGPLWQWLATVRAI